MSVASSAPDRIWTLSLCLLLAGVQGVGLDRPFLRHHESVSTEFSKHARNHLKFGLSKTFGLRLDVSGPDLGAYPEYRTFFYPDHPPLPALIVAGVFALAGPGEIPFRLTLIGFSLLALLLFRALARRLLPSPWDRAAALFFAFFPAFAYYSVVTCLQITCLVGILAALLFYLRWRDSGRARDYAGILGGIAFAGLCAWPGYYVALVARAARRDADRQLGSREDSCSSKDKVNPEVIKSWSLTTVKKGETRDLSEKLGTGSYSLVIVTASKTGVRAKFEYPLK